MATRKMLNFLIRFLVISSILNLIGGAPIAENAEELRVEVSDSPFIGRLHGVFDSEQEVHLICLHPDYNPSELSWYHGDEKLEGEDCSHTYLSCLRIILPSVTQESSGNLYTCRGTELKETSWATVQIYVKESAKKPEVEMSDPNVSETAKKFKVELSDRPFVGPLHAIVLTGQQVNLFCQHQDNNPAELSWYHGDEKLEAEDCSRRFGSCQNLILPSVTQESSGNVYTCRGTELKETSWATVQIYVNDASETATHPPKVDVKQGTTSYTTLLMLVLFLTAMIIIIIIVSVVIIVKHCRSSNQVQYTRGEMNEGETNHK